MKYNLIFFMPLSLSNDDGFASIVIACPRLIARRAWFILLSPLSGDSKIYKFLCALCVSNDPERSRRGVGGEYTFG